MKEAGALSSVKSKREEIVMIREFVGFQAYEKACRADLSLLGFAPHDVPALLRVSLRDVLRAVEDGVLDLVRIVREDGVQLIIPMYSIQRFKFPYEVESWRRRREHGPKSWQLLMLEADKLRGAWHNGFAK